MSNLILEESLPEHEASIHLFWKSIFVDQRWNEKAIANWQWMNSFNRHFIVRENEKILGNASMLTQAFILPDGTPIDMNWITQFYLSSELIGKGMGKKLTQALQDNSDYLATLGQSESARSCFSRLKWTGPTWIPMCAKRLLFSKLPKPSNDYEFVKFDFNNNDLEEIWENRGNRNSPIGIRSQSVLKKRLTGRPNVEYDIFIAKKQDLAKGWIVLRKIPEKNRMFGFIKVGLIVDVFAVDDNIEVLNALINYGSYVLGKSGMYFAMSLMTPGNTAKALLKTGFKKDISFLGVKLKSIPEKGFMISSQNKTNLSPPFHLSFLDCDAELTF